MILTEILDKPAEYKVTSDRPTKFWVSAVINGRTINFAAESYGMFEGLEWWEVSFMELKPTSIGGVSGTFKLTGSGGEFRVFATWKKFMRDFIDRYHPDVIFFTADKDHSRADLYEKLLKRFNIPEYEARRLKREGMKEDQFVLKRRTK